MAEARTRRSERAILAEHAPWKPPAYEDADVGALQALAHGRATMEQQKRALDWIILKACATYDFPYRPGNAEGERDTCVAIGRMFVGQQIVKLLKLKIGLLKPPRGGSP